MPLGRIKFRKPNLKNVARTMLAVSTGGASLAFKGARPAVPQINNSVLKNIARGGLAVMTGGASLAFKGGRPNLAQLRPVEKSSTPVVNTNMLTERATITPLKAVNPVVGYNKRTGKVVRKNDAGVNITINVK